MSAEEERSAVMACGTCKFGIYTPDSYYRDAPGVLAKPAKVECRRYPKYYQKMPDDWCGEHLKQEKPDAE